MSRDGPLCAVDLKVRAAPVSGSQWCKSPSLEFIVDTHSNQICREVVVQVIESDAYERCARCCGTTANGIRTAALAKIDVGVVRSERPRIGDRVLGAETHTHAAGLEILAP